MPIFRVVPLFLSFPALPGLPAHSFTYPRCYGQSWTDPLSAAGLSDEERVRRQFMSPFVEQKDIHFVHTEVRCRSPCLDSILFWSALFQVSLVQLCSVALWSALLSLVLLSSVHLDPAQF